MTNTATKTLTAWERILQGDELMQEYFAARSTIGDAVIFTCPHADEFNLALLDRVSPRVAQETLRHIVDCLQRHGATPRIRVSPLALTTGWPERLAGEGFIETEECRTFWSIPESVELTGNPDVAVTLATTPEEADLYSAIQTAGFDVPSELHDWDRELARKHVAAGRYRFYIGWLGGEPIGVASSVPLGNGLTGMWGIATLPAARRHGVGTAILQRMLDDARAEGSALNFFTTTWGNRVELTYSHLGCVQLFKTRTFELPGSLG